MSGREILDAVAESRAAIEINGDPTGSTWNALDSPARARGIKFIVSTDAHSTAAG